MKFSPFQLAGNVSMSANFASSVIDLQQVWVYSIQPLWSGPSVGELKLQASNDLVPQNVSQDSPYFNVVNWTTLSSNVSSVSSVAGSSSIMWNVQQPGYRWVRLFYTASSGGGTLNVNAMTKSS